MKKYTLVKVPQDSTEIFINNVGCLRYSDAQCRVSSVIEPMEMGVFLLKDEHKIVGDTFLKGERYIVIELERWNTEDLPRPQSIIDEGGTYYLVKVEGYFKPIMAMYLEDENGEAGWYVNYFSKIVKPVYGWIDVS